MDEHPPLNAERARPVTGISSKRKVVCAALHILNNRPRCVPCMVN